MRSATLVLITLLIAGPTAAASADSEGDIERLIAQEVSPMLPADRAGGLAVAVRIGRRTIFQNYGLADLANNRPITSDSLFNLVSLRKVFEVALLARAVKQGKLRLAEPVANYLPELEGDYVRRVTFGQLATHTSGLLLRTDYPPWPENRFSLPQFLDMLNAWKPEHGEEPGKQHIYTHAGFVLLQLALERSLGAPISELVDRNLLKPLGMTSTVLPEWGDDGQAKLPPALLARAVQGYSKHGEPIGAPGDQQGYFVFPGTAQMYSSARDLAALLAAYIGDLAIDPLLREAIQLTQQGMFRVSPTVTQAMAWELLDFGGPTILDKPGGSGNSSTYIGLLPRHKLGIVILANRGAVYPYEIPRRTLLPALARF
jgi:beta-lactamase class C